MNKFVLLLGWNLLGTWGTNWEHNYPKCYHVLNWFSLPTPDFLEFIWIFSCRNHLKIKYLPYSESKSYQINSIKSSYQDLSNNTKVTFQFLRNFQLQVNLILIFSEKIIQYSIPFALQVQTSWNPAHAPLVVIIESFPKTPRTWLEASTLSGSRNYKTKQNKTNYLFFIDK